MFKNDLVDLFLRVSLVVLGILLVLNIGAFVLEVVK